MSAPKVVGLDLSLAATGWATSDDHGTFPTSPDDPIEHRLNVIAVETLGIVDVLHAADLVVIEDFVTRSPAASLLGMVHGAVRLTLHNNATAPVVLVPPASLKKYATGKGNATKADMRVALLQRTGADVRDDNAVDACWLRLMGLDALGLPEVAMPAANRAALDKVQWPAEVLTEVGR